MNTIDATLPNASEECSSQSPSDAAWTTIDAALRELEETWRDASQPGRTHTAEFPNVLITLRRDEKASRWNVMSTLHTPLIADGDSAIKTEAVDPFEAPSGTFLAVEGRKMSDESAEQDGERSESQSALIDGTCSRFETAWRNRQQPRIEDFMPAESRDSTETTLRSLLVHLVGIDLEWRWKTADVPAETIPNSPRPPGDQQRASAIDSPRPLGDAQGVRGTNSPLPPGEGQGVRVNPLPPRPRLADYVARYPLLGPVEQLPM